MTPETSPRPWRERYHHGEPGKFIVYAANDQPVAEVQNQDPEAMAPDAHLVAAAPLLYEALRELLASTETALHDQGIGCECDRCEAAKQLAYRAIGHAEGKTPLKEGMPGTF